MLSKRDKEWLSKEISDAAEKAVNKALTVEMTWEKVLDDKTGQPLAAKELRKEDVFLPAFWTQHLKYHEGVYRGMRKTLGEQRNRLAGNLALNKGIIVKLEQVRKVFKGLQPTLLALTHFATGLEKSGILEQLEQALAVTIVEEIEDKSESSSG
jgi:hypothetical protein